MSVLGSIKDTIKGFFSARNEPPALQDRATEGVKDIHDTITQEQVVAEIKEKLQQAEDDRRPFELQWELNTNFLLGNQYCDIDPYSHQVIQIEKALWYQEREVFNQIAPIVETRLAKLSRVRPSMTVNPATNDFNDISTAKIATQVVKATQRKVELSRKLDIATAWSEITGTVFYKITWDFRGGKVIGYINDQAISEGDVDVYVAPSYEIYPENPFGPMEGQQWLIHRKAYHEDVVRDLWGANISGKDIEVYSVGQSTTGTGGLGYTVTVPNVYPATKKNQVDVIEYFERPTKRYPHGRWIIIAEDTLLYYGALPYKNGEDGKRDFPFGRQAAIEHPGCFWGVSVIERLIPIQRRYNAVKNRKHEYLNFMALGVLDIPSGVYENEEEFQEGIGPGSILWRHSGESDRAVSLDFGNSSGLQWFDREEEKLHNDFILISGVSEISRNSNAPTGVSSGVALDILREQDDTRLSLTAEHIRAAVMQMAKQWLRLYRQFAIGPRLDRLVGDDKDILVTEWSKNDLTSDDISFDTENELAQTPAQRKSQVFDMLKAGLFNDPNTGRLNRRMLSKVFEMLQFGNWESGLGVEDMHIKRAQRENVFLSKDQAPEIWEIDDDQIHIEEHTRFMLSGEFVELKEKKPEMAQLLEDHLKLHEASMKFKAQKAQMEQMQMQGMMMPGMTSIISTSLRATWLPMLSMALESMANTRWMVASPCFLAYLI